MTSPNMTRCSIAAALTLMLFTGCTSKQDAAIDRARQQVATTGQAQQVISVDKNGSTTTTTIQPPAPGQTAQTVTTTVVSQAHNQPQSSQANTSVQAVAQTGPPASSGAPVIRPADVNVAAGTLLAIRINQHISVKTNRAGDRFTGEVVEPVAGRNNQVVIPQGARVEGVIDASHRRGHFKGSSILELRLTTLYLNGTSYPIDTNDLTRSKKGKGKRSAAFIGGGAGLGMLVGGVATGGVGLLVGGLAGAGAGTAIGGLTGNRDIEIPSESIVRFRLADDLVL